MSFELVREVIKVNQVVGAEYTQAVIENDIIVPDVKPDIARILLLDGDVTVNGADASQDKILVDGDIHYKILYISEDEQTIKSINASSGFDSAVDVSGARQGMKCKAKCNIEHMEYDILNGRKINVKTILQIHGKAVNEAEQNVVSSIGGDKDIQLLTENYYINSFIGRGVSSSTIKENLEVPAGKPSIREILRSDVKITGKDYKIADNKVIAKGEFNISTLYTGDDESGSLQYMEHEVPFTQFIELPSAEGDTNCEVEYRISEELFEVEEDSDGEPRIIKAEVSLDASVEGFTGKNIEVVEDAYSPNSRMSLEKEYFRVEEYIEENKSQVTLRESVKIDEESPDISEVFNVLSKPVLSEYKVTDDKIIVEGVVSNNVLYLVDNPEQPVFCSIQEIPLKHIIDLKGARPEMDCDINLNIEHCSYSMVSSKEVELRLVIGVSARLVNRIDIPVINKVSEMALEGARLESQPSITIYFSQPGDTLWKIAKKYYTTLEDIRKVNDISDSDSITPGQQIIIPKRSA